MAEPRQWTMSWKLQALFWGSTMFLFWQLYRVWDDRPITAFTLVLDTAAWSMGGLLFGLTMRWWGTRHAR